jgi:hypothetical protein
MYTKKTKVVKIEGVRVYDADAEEVFVNANGQPPVQGVCPSLAGQSDNLMTLQLFSLMGKLFLNHTDVFIFGKGRFRDGSLDKQILHEILPSCDRHIWQQLLQEKGDVKCGPDDLPLCKKVIYISYYEEG